MSELKPCPFCGGEAEEYNNSDFHDCYRVYCMGCGAETQAEEEWQRVKKWNKREGESKLAAITAECIGIGYNHVLNKIDEYEREIRIKNDQIDTFAKVSAMQQKDINRQKQEIIEYKAFMLCLKLSSEDEARMMDLLAKYKKAN